MYKRGGKSLQEGHGIKRRKFVVGERKLYVGIEGEMFDVKYMLGVQSNLFFGGGGGMTYLQDGE